ncbi:MAG TPA: UDP-2,3-diacylglucosamine diphosphatase LpxI [Thermohalobaculum sp.]|nr:UDP-2,3-diacylglucosamine diphosphatase LpxI [Thermohalobaculum sp.]
MPEGAGPPGPLAIVAGGGVLPRRLAEARQAAGLPYLVVSFPDGAGDWIAAHPHEHHRFERPGRVFRALHKRGVRHAVLAGDLARPRLRPWALDLAGLRALARAPRMLGQGDDALLGTVAEMFRREGIEVIGADEVLGEALTVPAGPLGRLAPRPRDLADAARAARIVAALGPLDVGQAAVVARGLCLGVEAIEGTDLMLERVAALPAERRRAAPPPSGVLWKAPKPGQDRRFDMPTVGPRTVGGVRAAGLSGIAVAAGAVLCPERDAMRRAADDAGLFVYGARPEELE